MTHKGSDSAWEGVFYKITAVCREAAAKGKYYCNKVTELGDKRVQTISLALVTAHAQLRAPRMFCEL